MSTPSDPVLPPEELASGYVDGELSPDQRRLVEADPSLMALVANHTVARDAVAAAVPPLSAGERDRLIATALAASTVAPVVPITTARSTRWRQAAIGGLVAAAAAGLVAVVLVRPSSDDQADGGASADTAATAALEAVETTVVTNSLPSFTPAAGGGAVTTAAAEAADAATQASDAARGSDSVHQTGGPRAQLQPGQPRAGGPRPAGQPAGSHRRPRAVRRRRHRRPSPHPAPVTPLRWRRPRSRAHPPSSWSSRQRRRATGWPSSMPSPARSSSRSTRPQPDSADRVGPRGSVPAPCPKNPPGTGPPRSRTRSSGSSPPSATAPPVPLSPSCGAWCTASSLPSAPITALVLLSIVLIRVLTELTGESWIAFLITSGIFLAIGAFLMLKARHVRAGSAMMESTVATSARACVTSSSSARARRA